MMSRTTAVLDFALVLGLAVLFAVSSHADIPLMLNHQGLMKVDGEPFSGAGYFKFGLYDVGGTWLWTNDGTHIGEAISTPPDTAVQLAVNTGIYHVRLGDATLTNMTAIASSVFDGDDVKLRIIFNDGINAEQTLSPDQPVTSSAYAYHAALADTATYAVSAAAATTATNADHATTADSATNATNADDATHADDADTVGGKLPADLIPTGVIVMWSGAIADIPTGWTLCDGSNGSPDLRDRFVVGAKQDDGGVPKTNIKGSLMQTGGSHQVTLTVSEMPSHTHGGYIIGNAGQGAYNYGPGQLLQECRAYDAPLDSKPTGGGQAHENTPPFYALAFIMKL